MKKISYIVLSSFVFLLISCTWGATGDKKGEVSITLDRYDKVLFEYVAFDKFSAMQKLQTDYLPESQLLVEEILDLGSINDARFPRELKDYYSDSILSRLLVDTQNKFENVGRLEKQLSAAFTSLKKDLPSITIPQVYTQVSAFNQSIVVKDDHLGISLDKYMGVDYPLYKSFFYDYQIRYMSPRYIVSDCMLYYLVSIYPFPWQSRRMLIDHMIHEAKIHWLCMRALGQKSIAENLGYTEEETKWCEKNEAMIWNTMKEKNYLYSSDPKVLRDFTREAPCTECFGPHSPALLGSWIAGRMLESYMSKNKVTDYEAFMSDDNFQQIFLDSGYEQ